MSQIFLDFRPAEVVCNKELYISYYAYNPQSERFERKRIRLNHIKGTKSQRLAYAKRFCLEVNNKLQQGWNPFQSDLTVTLFSMRSVIEEYMKNKFPSMRLDSVRCYKSYCLFLLSWLELYGLSDKPISDFDFHTTKMFLADISKRRLSGRTYNNYLHFYRTLFNDFLTYGYISKNYFSDFPSMKEEEKIRQIIPPEVRSKIRDYFIDNNLLQFVVFMSLCYCCFIRPKEILNLRLEYVDFKNSVINLPGSITKNHKPRTVAPPLSIMNYLISLSSFPRDYYIFSTNYLPGSRLYNTRDVGKTWAKMRDDLHLPKSYQFYSLKDSGITDMLDSGVSPKLVRDLAGHQSLDMTQKYTRLADAKKILEQNNLHF